MGRFRLIKGGGKTAHGLVGECPDSEARQCFRPPLMLSPDAVSCFDGLSRKPNVVIPHEWGAMKRREFIGLLGGAATIPFVAHAQQSERMRSIGVLLPASPDDPVFQARLAAFRQELALLGWIIGRNVRIDTRWATTNPAEIRRNATELVALAPDVILSTGDSTVPPLLQATRTVPIVFPVANDPIGAGYVNSLARPGGNVTGFMIHEYSTGVKWLELLKEVSPNVTRVAVLRDSANPAQPPSSASFRL
jgi:putative tryptophan/tyrosine transport system substrate-binding protein